MSNQVSNSSREKKLMQQLIIAVVGVSEKIQNFLHTQISDQLVKMKRFVDKLCPSSSRQAVTTKGDAIGSLIGICAQRGWPIPKYV